MIENHPFRQLHSLHVINTKKKKIRQINRNSSKIRLSSEMKYQFHRFQICNITFPMLLPSVVLPI